MVIWVSLAYSCLKLSLKVYTWEGKLKNVGQKGSILSRFRFCCHPRYCCRTEPASLAGRWVSFFDFILYKSMVNSLLGRKDSVISIATGDLAWLLGPYFGIKWNIQDTAFVDAFRLIDDGKRKAQKSFSAMLTPSIYKLFSPFIILFFGFCSFIFC